ncbi:MAG: peptidylprolyl isomerase, partial [Chloroflexota bacterium]
FVGYADEIGVDDIDQFQADLENDTFADKVLADYETAIAANLTGTPTLFVNQVDFPAQAFGTNYDGIDLFIKLMQLRDRWYSEPEVVINPDKSYIATIETESGDVVIELFPDTAPTNVNSFAFLAQEGWYEGISFHRVLPDFMAQGGDPTGTGVGFPGYRCGDEVTAFRTFEKEGVVALANSGPNSNGSQFFITYGPTPQLNAGFTIIGQVIEGMDVVRGITPRDPQANPDFVGDTILNIRVEEQ